MGHWSSGQSNANNKIDDIGEDVPLYKLDP